MTTVGLVGGLGPESTIDYYRRIIDGWAREHPSTSPSILIDSLDVQRALRLVASDRAGFADYLLGSIRRLAAAGADFAVLTANTPHLVFDELARQSRIPLLSIVETCAAEAARLGMYRPALLGTRFTMEARFYPDVCARSGLAVVIPDDAERDWIHQRYVGELLEGKFLDGTREHLASIVTRLRDVEHADGVILGGTELPLLVTSPRLADIPVLDTTGLHVAAIVRRLAA